MTYEEAQVRKKELNDKVDVASKRLQWFETNAVGLVPDNVRDTPEWKQANDEFNKSFAELREFNAWYVKTFMKKGKRS